MRDAFCREAKKSRRERYAVRDDAMEMARVAAFTGKKQK